MNIDSVRVLNRLKYKKKFLSSGLNALYRSFATFIEKLLIFVIDLFAVIGLFMILVWLRFASSVRRRRLHDIIYKS